MSSFEEAMHHGYSQADVDAEMKEVEDTMTRFGCFTCVYRRRASPTCARLIDDGTLEKCPYYKKEEET